MPRKLTEFEHDFWFWHIVSNQLGPMKSEYDLWLLCFFPLFLQAFYSRSVFPPKWIWHLSLETMGDRIGWCLNGCFSTIKKQQNKINSLKCMPYRRLKQQQHLLKGSIVACHISGQRSSSCLGNYPGIIGADVSSHPEQREEWQRTSAAPAQSVGLGGRLTGGPLCSWWVILNGDFCIPRSMRLVEVLTWQAIGSVWEEWSFSLKHKALLSP